MYRSKIILLVIVAIALGCTQTRTSTVVETIPDSTLPAGSKKTTSLTLGGNTYTTERVGPNSVVELGHGNFFNGKALYVMSNDQQLTYKESGNV